MQCASSPSRLKVSSSFDGASFAYINQGKTASVYLENFEWHLIIKFEKISLLRFQSISFTRRDISKSVLRVVKSTCCDATTEAFPVDRVATPKNFREQKPRFHQLNCFLKGSHGDLTEFPKDREVIKVYARTRRVSCRLFLELGKEKSSQRSKRLEV